MTLDQWCKNEGWHLDEASQEFRDFGREVWDYQQGRIDLLEEAIRKHRDSFNNPDDYTGEDLELWALLQEDKPNGTKAVG